MNAPARKHLPKKTLAALGKVFAAEIENRLPFQSKAKVYADLCVEGLLEPMQRVVGRGFPVAMVFNGYQLTHAGRYAYCASCEDAADD